ncbi:MULTISPECIES: Smr/MutS family protein [Asaia]|uniref:Smr/MutS family protein n=1 Tax=Asaia TaxID=91914 RepID=UPI0025573CB3|nr:Smr/MutS family protein [Asaia sp. HumB]MDL2170039.1 Smr/MutS family protein [Asaia sp. HumB]
MSRRDLSSEDETLWQAFTRTIMPLRAAGRAGRRSGAASRGKNMRPVASGRSIQRDAAGAVDVETSKTSPAPRYVVREVMRVATHVAKPAITHDRLEINGRQPGLDTTSWNALATGKMKPQKRLDLHGHFAQDAFYKLHHFLHAASKQGIRCVEVITGLGSGQEGGVIRQELPHWLERGDLRPLILAVVHTHKRNKGAVRILLRARHRL